MFEAGDRLDLSGIFDEEGITLKNTGVKHLGEYRFSIQLSFEGTPGSIAGAVDISTSGDIMAIELVGIDQAIAYFMSRSDNEKD
ncbi:hypothetical protein [Corynebacterium lactis]|uniref:Uncharacterized protein n=1 Tax=Corynebacterium lactis RW2-5 TaxID=1408189 RepID=A0A0K2H3S4_9CORY|nr:hypothetical protein [Corynebacterium lactis]ALA68689.1 hypothetical protein CLAC_10425 [Corynebacterium lactis RW2-5]